MRLISFRRIGYYISIVALSGVTALFAGSVNPVSSSETVLAASDPVIAAAGDIACDPSSSSFNNGNGTSGSCRQKYTSDLLVNTNLAAVLALGDNQYYCGGYQAFMQAYDPSWGRVKSITHPAVGNHEYLTSGGTDCTIDNTGAAGYFNYFGAAAGDPSQGYYSFDIGTWHLIALNSNCSSAGGCGTSSPQGQWLVADLNAHPNYCTLAFWHIPLFSSGGRANSNTQSIWQILYDHNVDVILNGHDHIYERFAPQAPDGSLDMVRGMREFIVGSGGANHTSLASIAANSEVRNTDTYGVLNLTLHPTSYDWQFVPEAGKTFTDSGTENCHGDALPNTPTATPTGPTATSTVTSTPTATNTFGPSPTRTPTPTNTPIPTTFSFTPVDDTFVYQTNATTNYGSATSLQTDNSPVKHILLKFNVAGLSGQQIIGAKLRLYDADPSNTGGDFYRVSDNTWQEGTVTWSTAPTIDTTLLASLGSVSAGNWYEVDLSSLITDEGTYSLAIISTDSNGADYSSKEGTDPPQLIVEAQNSSTSTATDTPTMTATWTPINTLTPTPTSTYTPTPTNTATSTAMPISTSTQTSTPTLTNTVTSTAALTSTTTVTSTWTPTSTSIPTFTPTSLFTATNTFTSTPTASATSTASATFTAAPTVSPSSTPSPTATFAATNTAVPAVLTFTPADDAYVYQNHASTNYGSATSLQTDGSPVKHILLKFNVNGLGGQQITNATLRLYNVDNSNIGGDFYRVSDNTWQEGTVTWDTAPASDTTLLASLGSVSTDTWYEVDLSSLITGEGTYSLMISSTAPNGADYSSKEGTDPPQLIVEAQNSSTSTATDTPTMTATWTPINTATPMPTSTYTPTPTSPNTATSTAMPMSTSTQTSTPTLTNTVTSTTTSTWTPTSIYTPTPTSMPTSTQTLQPSATSADTFTPTPTTVTIFTPTPTFSATATLPLGNSPTPTITSTIPATNTPSATPSYTPTAPATDTPTIEPSPIPTATYTAIPTFTATPVETATFTPSPTMTDTPAPLTFVFIPEADAYVNESNPTSNYGGSTSIRVDGSPIVISYLRFNVQGLSGTVARVMLWVYANSSSSSGYTVSRVTDSTWDEASIDYNNAPPIGNEVGSSTSFSGGTWTTVDVTSFVTGDGVIEMALSTSNSTAINLASRESGANAPQLVIETSP